MWIKYISYLKVAILGVAAFFVFSCTDSSTEVKEVIETTKTKKKSKGIVYKPSELAITMRRMYVNMKLVNELLEAGSDIPDSLITGYESMLTDIPTNPQEIGAKFGGFAEGWLLELEALKNEPTIENYNALMNACVHCHQSFCPGPIKKIKRLRLIGPL
ncbi:MAG: hypothetical protein ACI85Q_002350 [Salibacteraceae bacterium]|jgi:hypothetical protein